MGVVYRARQVRTGRNVALKVLINASKSEMALQRFELEAQALARLDHPNVVRVYAAGQEQGRSYLAMELVTGESLQERLQAGPLPVALAAQLVRDLASGLAHVHERGLLHRDIKPSNVLISDTGTPKLTDFGLAKDLTSSTGLTASGVFMGTAGFCPPEQARGLRDQLGPWTDVFGLGATLYAALTGRPPFMGQNLVEVMVRTESMPPDLPSLHREGVNRDLDAICLRCLEKDPRDRYESASQLATVLDAYLNGESLAPAPAKRSRLFGLGLALALASLALAWGLRPASLPSETPTPPPSGPERPRATPASAAAEEAAAAQELGEAKQWKQAEAGWTRALELDAEHEASLHGRARARFYLRNYPDAIADSNRCLKQHGDRAGCLNLRAMSKRFGGDPKGALNDLDRALALAPEDLMILVNRADLRMKAKNLSGAKEDLEKALRVNEKFVDAWVSRANLRGMQGKHADAVSDLEHAIALEPKRAETYRQLFFSLVSSGSDDEAALGALDRVLELDPKDVSSYCNRASMFASKKRLPEAIADYQSALKVQPDYVMALANLAQLQRRAGRPQQALASFRRWVALEPKSYLAVKGLAEILAETGNRRAAIGELTRILKLLPKATAALYQRGVLFTKLSEHENAIADFTQILTIRPQHWQAQADRGISWSKLGKHQRALADFDTVLERKKLAAPHRTRLRRFRDEAAAQVKRRH